MGNLSERLAVRAAQAILREARDLQALREEFDHYCDRWGHAWQPPATELCACFMAMALGDERPASCVAVGAYACPCRAGASCWEYTAYGEQEACPCGCPRWDITDPGIFCTNCEVLASEAPWLFLTRAAVQHQLGMDTADGEREEG